MSDKRCFYPGTISPDGKSVRLRLPTVHPDADGDVFSVNCDVTGIGRVVSRHDDYIEVEFPITDELRAQLIDAGWHP